jgi:hypothetical protein
MFRAAIIAATVLSGCATVAEDQRGSVYEITDKTVTIRGAFSLNGQTAKPTPAMAFQAREICPGATYLSANPSPTDNYTFLYLFRC